jgi:ribose 5-phosphate isomerase B
MSSALPSNFTHTVFVAADHAGFVMKEKLKVRLLAHGLSVVDVGAHALDPLDDYTEAVRPVGDQLIADTAARAIVFCGSGQGEGIALNRRRGVRAAVFYGPRAALEPIEMERTSPSVDGYDPVRLARMHNDANALCIGARFVTEEEAYHAALLFIGTPFSGTERHVRRIHHIDE